MAAGAIPPENAFPYVFNGGADFVLAGMFDFEIAPRRQGGQTGRRRRLRANANDRGGRSRRHFPHWNETHLAAPSRRLPGKAMGTVFTITVAHQEPGLRARGGPRRRWTAWNRSKRG